MRQMERLLAKALRKAATRLATGAALVDGRDVVASALEPVAASVSGSTTGVVTTAA